MNNKLEFHLDDTVLYSGTVSDVRGFSTKTSNVHLFIHFLMHLLSACCMLVSLQGAGEAEMNKTQFWPSVSSQ